MMEIGFEELAMNVNNPNFGDDRLAVMFYKRVVEDERASREQGRKIFVEKEYVKVMIPGERQPAVDREVQRTGTLPTDDRMRFARQYERFKAREDQKMAEGTPVHLWPQIPAALAEELKYLNIFTVEQLAELSDTYVGKIPQGNALKANAKAFVLAMKDQEQVNKLQSQLSERDARIAALENELKELGATVRELSKKGK
jgi:hypothetical protein